MLSKRIDITLSPICLETLQELQDSQKITNRSEMMERLILSQKYPPDEVEKMVLGRPKRGRRWPEKPAE